MRAIIFIVILLNILFSTQYAEAQTIKLGTLAPDGSPWYTSLRDMDERWKEASNDEVRLKIYPGGILGDEADMIRRMRIGQLHAATLSAVGLGQIIPEINAIQMPLLFDSYEELDYVREKLTPRFEKLLEDKGFIVLSWGDAGWVHIFSQKPVVYPNDLKGQKIFVWAGESETFAAWKAAGFHPVEVAATDILTSLQTGLVNVYNTTPLLSLSFQWFALAKNMTDLPWMPFIGATVITKKRWEQIPDEIRPALKNIAMSNSGNLKAEIRALDKKAVEVMKKQNLVVHHVPLEAENEWKRMADKYVYDEFLDKLFPREIFEEVRRLLDEYRAQKFMVEEQ